MAISSQDKQILLMRSGGRCGICSAELVSKGKVKDKPKAEYAHIKGHRKGSARFDKDLPLADRNSYTNIFVLCPSCHTTIDKDEITYTSEWLYTKKIAHEAEVARLIKQLTLEVSYKELAHTLSYLSAVTIPIPPETLQVILPKDKIDKNNLSMQVEEQLRVGLLQNSQIEDFLNKNIQMGYAEKIRGYFVIKYLELKDSGLSGDDLFYAMWGAVNHENTEAKYFASSLSVLSYYFYLCEVFEK